MRRVPIFDLDGTLIDSDQALAGAFVTLGVDIADITFGHVLAEECDRLGLTVDAYLDAYDVSASIPFDGVVEVLSSIETWSVCSNKHPRSGRAELRRLGWEPRHAFFADAFDGPKRLAPVLAELALEPDEVIFVGDTAHDRRCALDASVPFLLAGWNPRAVPAPGDIVLTHPLELLEWVR